jgi:hypothetical protein
MPSKRNRALESDSEKEETNKQWLGGSLVTMACPQVADGE